MGAYLRRAICGVFGIIGSFLIFLWGLLFGLYYFIDAWGNVEFFCGKIQLILDCKTSEWAHGGAQLFAVMSSSALIQVVILLTGLSLLLYSGYRESRKNEPKEPGEELPYLARALLKEIAYNRSLVARGKVQLEHRVLDTFIAATQHGGLHIQKPDLMRGIYQLANWQAGYRAAVNAGRQTSTVPTGAQKFYPPRAFIAEDALKRFLWERRVRRFFRA